MKSQKILGVSLELSWTIFSSIIAASFLLGLYFGQAKFDKEKSDYYFQNVNLTEENKTLRLQVDSLRN